MPLPLVALCSSPLGALPAPYATPPCTVPCPGWWHVHVCRCPRLLADSDISVLRASLQLEWGIMPYDDIYGPKGWCVAEDPSPSGRSVAGHLAAASTALVWLISGPAMQCAAEEADRSMCRSRRSRSSPTGTSAADRGLAGLLRVEATEPSHYQQPLCPSAAAG
jgi:hypothetical protein